MINKFLKNHRKIAILLLIFNFLFVSSAFGAVISDSPKEDIAEIFPFAKEDKEEKYTEDLLEITDDGVGLYKPKEKTIEGYKDSIAESLTGENSFTKNRLEGIKRNLKEEINIFNTLEKKVDRIEAGMEPMRKKIEGIKSQIDLFNSQLSESKNKIKNTELQIAEKQIDLKKLMKDLKEKEVLFNIQKKAATDYIILLYQEEEKFLDYYEDSSRSLKLLLADNSISENLLGLEYSKVLEEAGRKVFYDLYNKKVELEERRDMLEKGRAKLSGLNKTLNQEKRILQEGKKSKKDLLAKTLGQEAGYKKLLEQSIQQQLESAIAIQNIKEDIDLMMDKLQLSGDSSLKDIDFRSDIASINSRLQTEFLNGESVNVRSASDRFIWPVPPSAITAYFHDPTYPKKWGTHQAIDIRAKQYTEIRAPANGYVFQTKDNGMGYSYVILAHKNKLITVYGHVSEIMVKQGTVVRQGDVIGLSGGTPGTKGAGWQTTGAHLHFEVWHKGKPVNPLNWLPVFKLPAKYIPKEFIK